MMSYSNAGANMKKAVFAILLLGFVVILFFRLRIDDGKDSG